MPHSSLLLQTRALLQCTGAAMDSNVAAYIARAQDNVGVKMFVQLRPSEYADVMKKTRRFGTAKVDFGDEDGECTFFMRDNDLYLRTAHGEVKGVLDMDSQRGLGCRAVSPLGRFVEYCYAAGVSSDQAVLFQKELKNEVLLDAVVAHMQPGVRHAAFVYVAKMPQSGALSDMLFPAVASLAAAAKQHTVFLALVRRPGVDIGRLVKHLRRAPATTTLNVLRQSDVADAVISAVAEVGTPVPAAAARPRQRPRAAMTPRSRFFDYVYTHGVSEATAAEFADAWADDCRLDAVVLSKDTEGAKFHVLVRSLGELQRGPLQLVEGVERLPALLRAATCLAFCYIDVDVEAVVARLRLADPWRVPFMLSTTPGIFRNSHFDNHEPLKTVTTAERACAACGATGDGDERKLRMCSACQLVLYCSPTCQRSHWKAHKAACKAARGAK